MRISPLDTRPERRALRIFAFDPMLARGGDHRVTVEVPYRKITHNESTFGDDRLQVIDYDAAAKRYYRAVNLDDAEIAMQQGLEPSDADPQFHQQMVYAVASRVLENFDRALGRRLRFWGGQRLRLLPHAFQGRNAYYDQGLNAVLFGYFPADEDDPGANLPGQAVFTCLSHDIIAHEMTHAALDRLHRYYREPTNPHVPALHEGFADLIAIFQRFTFPEVVRHTIRETRGDLLQPNPTLEIGAQFGAAAGLGSALRSVGSVPDASAVARATEPHELGRLLVSAVHDGFVRTYTRRTADLLRIATGGSGRLPAGELHPDLVHRLATECARTAQAVLLMCIRATDYMPPVDPTLSDFLRAMVTADFELNRNDEHGLRAGMIEAFRLRGIRPEAVGSLAVESLLLEPEGTGPVDDTLAEIVSRLLRIGALEMSRNVAPPPSAVGPTARRRLAKVSSSADFIAQQQAELMAPDAPADSEEVSEEEEPQAEWRRVASDLNRWAKPKRASLLGLDDSRKVQVAGFHPVHRIAPGGGLLVEMVAKFVQTRPIDGDFGGLAYRAGATIIATVDGRLRYVVRKPFQAAREHALREWVGAFDRARGPSWPTGTPGPQRIVQALSLRAMDARRLR